MGTGAAENSSLFFPLFSFFLGGGGEGVKKISDSFAKKKKRRNKLNIEKKIAIQLKYCHPAAPLETNFFWRVALVMNPREFVLGTLQTYLLV